VEDLSVNLVKRGAMYDLLQDPYNDRMVKDLPLPPCKPIAEAILFKKNDKTPNWELLK
jgi:hypothetical protein